MEDSNDKKDNKINKRELIKFLPNFQNMRIGQDQVIWLMYNGFWAINILLLLNLFLVKEQWYEYGVLVFISLVGIFISLIWFHIQERLSNRLIMLENTIKYIERELYLPDELKTYSASPISSLFNFVRALDVMKYSIILLFLFWFAFLIISFGRLDLIHFMELL